MPSGLTAGTKYSAGPRTCGPAVDLADLRGSSTLWDVSEGDTAEDAAHAWQDRVDAMRAEVVRRQAAQVTEAQNTPASATAITGERVPYCNDCPDGVPQHSRAIHLPDQDWVDRTVREYGPDHPYVIAKVHAKFRRAVEASPSP